MLLEVDGIHTYHGEAHVLHGVSLEVDEGEVVAVVGRNGAGKTTTLRSIMGLPAPARGRITFRGHDLAGLDTHEITRRGIAWVPEERRILPNLTVLENLRLAMLPAAASDRASRLGEVWEFFPRLRERIGHKGRFLSGGEQQMLAIARALVARPALILVDEPTEGLSPVLVDRLTTVLAEINRRGTAILLVEQMLEVALTVSRRVYVIDHGEMQFHGSAMDLRADRAVQQRFLGV
jgi:branched-chain amino acid transport system ATP-binding protein